MKIHTNKAVRTNQISVAEAEEWFKLLSDYTDNIMKQDWGWYVAKGYYPIKAQVQGAGESLPVFTVHHHTGNKNKDYRPAMHRFLQAEKASSNFVVAGNGNIIYLVKLGNKSFHCVRRVWFPEKILRSFNIGAGFLDEPGIETAGNGLSTLFNYEQFLSLVILQRYLNAYYPSMKRISSHKRFSPKSRAFDPGPLYLLPLVEHAAFNDVNLKSCDYWLEQYRKDPIKVVNNASSIMKEYGVQNKDEWADKRSKMKIDGSYL